MSKPPSLSVLVANYNQGRFLRESLGALIGQSYKPREIVVLDDGSTDDSREIIAEFARREPRIRPVSNERNRGAVFSLNRLLDLASGDYVYMAAADDRVLPGLLERSMDILERFPEAGLCCSDPAMLDDRTGRVRDNRMRLSDEPRCFSPEEWCRLSRYSRAWIAGHTVVAKRSALIEAGGLLPELKWHCDWFAWLVVGFRYGVCYVPEPLALFRTLSGSYSSAGMKRREEQRVVYGRLLELLKSQAYGDVRPLFERSRSLAHPGTLRAILSDRRHWDYLSADLVSRVVMDGIKRRVLRAAARIGRISPGRAPNDSVPLIPAKRTGES